VSEREIVLLGHGSGGTLSHALVRDLFLAHFADSDLASLEDATEIALADEDGRVAGRVVITTDSYVVKPRFFPGGDIGKLAICGTVNDLAMRGARPLYLTAGFILEEGLSLEELERVVRSMAQTAREAGVRIVAGDTKVVERGSADGLFINTAGVGVVPPGVSIGAGRAQVGDAILVSGAVGDHGLTVMTQREGLRFDSSLQSDCAPLGGLVDAMLTISPQSIHVLRDPTRGGLATTLCEIAEQSRVGIEVEESRIPVHDAVRAASEILGLDPLYVANEGKLVAFVAPQAAEDILAAMRAHPLGREAARIGWALEQHRGRVALRTPFGARRVLNMLAGEQLPRIC
jgi:hydrogenase expression/formation protein HypE